MPGCGACELAQRPLQLGDIFLATEFRASVGSADTATVRRSTFSGLMGPACPSAPAFAVPYQGNQHKNPTLERPRSDRVVRHFESLAILDLRPSLQPQFHLAMQPPWPGKEGGS